MYLLTGTSKIRERKPVQNQKRFLKEENYFIKKKNKFRHGWFCGTRAAEVQLCGQEDY